MNFYQHLPHSFSAAVTASSINGLLKQVGIETGGCTSTTRDPGIPTASRVCTMENASRVFPYTRALPEIKEFDTYFEESLFCCTLNIDQSGYLQTSAV